MYLWALAFWMHLFFCALFYLIALPRTGFLKMVEELKELFWYAFITAILAISGVIQFVISEK